jgi:predicted PurR-regulated permease PerM
MLNNNSTIPFGERITRMILLLLILLLIVLSVLQLPLFMPGILGAVTLYILSRQSYFYLIFHRKWRKEPTTWLYIVCYIVLLGLPVMFLVKMVGPRVQSFLENPEQFIEQLRVITDKLSSRSGFSFAKGISISKYSERLIAILPSLLNNSLTLLTNFILMLFFLYYMLSNGSAMERLLFKWIPLNDENTRLLALETKKMVRANALGIPLISIIQGAAATLGYWIWDVEDFALLGVLTGLFAFFPVLGTLVVWVPLVIYMYASGDTQSATGLLLYSAIVTGNIDYVARITIMRRMGDTHPVITVLGIIIGLGLFGFIGLVFGPLLVSYIIILTKIYRTEFMDGGKNVQPVEQPSPSQDDQTAQPR